MKRFLFAGLALLLCSSALARPRIAIIIDDLGYHRHHGEQIVALPGAVTCAVLPDSPHGPRLARQAHQQHKEVMVHLPMAAQHDVPLDRGGLHLNMEKKELITRVHHALDRLPQASGLNNHMGSALTEQAQPMAWLMTELKTRQLFFVDSRTTADSVAEQQARHAGLAHGKRDVFLDNQRDVERINEQFNKLITLARRRGQAIAIGHPYPETVHYLQQVLPLMDAAGIDLVPASQLLHPPAETAMENRAARESDTGS